MNYDTMRPLAESGDVLMQEGRGPVSLVVRAFTGHSISHVAMLIWIDGGLWVVEMREFVGMRLTPASQWVQHHAPRSVIYWGQAPDIVVQHGHQVAEVALSQRWARYSYFEVARLWLSRPFRFNSSGSSVCSTMIAKCWTEGAGYVFRRPPFPGAFLRKCPRVSALEVD